MASKHNAAQQQVNLKAQKPVAPAAKAQKPVDEGRPVGAAEAVLLLVEEMVRLVALTLKGDLTAGKLLGYLVNTYIPAFERLGAKEDLVQAQTLANLIRSGSRGQCELYAAAIVDVNDVRTTPVEGVLVGRPSSITNANNLRTVYQRIDCGPEFGTVTARLVGSNGEYVDEIGVTYVIKK